MQLSFSILIFARNFVYKSKVPIWIFISGVILLQLASSMDNNYKKESDLFDRKMGRSHTCGQNFLIKGISSIHMNNSTIVLQIKADSLTQKPREGRKFLFNSYYELYIEKLVLNQPVNELIMKLDLKDLIRNTKLGDKQIKSMNNLMGCWLSRILVDDIQINFKPIDEQVVALSASYARMTSDAVDLKFEHNVNLRTDSCRILSRVAIWSNKYNGLFLPEPYTINEKERSAGDFYQISRDGACIKLDSAPTVEYSDTLDNIENELFNNFFPRSIIF